MANKNKIEGTERKESESNGDKTLLSLREDGTVEGIALRCYYSEPGGCPMYHRPGECTFDVDVERLPDELQDKVADMKAEGKAGSIGETKE
ncbi:MAG: hypothetical protein ABIA47_02015 [bacterium]